jgi:uncharacterized protein (DUF433 family)
MLTRTQTPRIPASVSSDPSVMGGAPVIRGTRVPAETIIAYLRAGYTAQEIFDDYPSLPLDGIQAVTDWAERTHGPNWRETASTA